MRAHQVYRKGETHASYPFERLLLLPVYVHRSGSIFAERRVDDGDAIWFQRSADLLENFQGVSQVFQHIKAGDKVISVGSKVFVFQVNEVGFYPSP